MGFVSDGLLSVRLASIGSSRIGFVSDGLLSVKSASKVLLN